MYSPFVVYEEALRAADFAHMKKFSMHSACNYVSFLRLTPISYKMAIKTIRVFEAFAGYGSQAVALKRLQATYPDKVHFDFVGISEIDPNAIKAYKALHGGVKNFGDICNIDWGGGGRKYLILTYLHTVSLVNRFQRRASKPDLPKARELAPHYCGSAKKP